MSTTVAANAPIATATSPSTERGPRAWRVFLLALGVFFLAEAAWTYATPLLAAPDEPSQIVKAAAVARGEWTALCFDVVNHVCVPDPTSANGLVDLPTFYDLVHAPDTNDPAHSQICFHAHPTEPASCARSLNRQANQADIVGGYNKFSNTYQARYPPLYYFLAGQPSRLGGGTWALYLMRLWSAFLSSALLALAATVCIAWSASRLLRFGLLVAATPMTLYLGAVINPSGLEIAAAVACWSALVVLVTERPVRHRRALSCTAIGSAMVFEAVRSLSPFWLLLAVGFCALASAPRRLGELLRERLLQVGAVAVVLVAAASLLWTVVEHATDLYTSAAAAVPASTSTLEILKESFRHNVYYLPTMIGIFGWFDARSPQFTFVIWYVVALGLLLLSVLRSGWRERLAVVGLFLAVLLVPVLISSSQARVHGYVWSGRDTLPLAVGLPLLAAAITDRSGVVTRSRFLRPGERSLAVLLFVASLGGFYFALRRYAVGTSGPVFSFLVHPSWRPVTGLLAPLLAEAFALAAGYLLMLRSAARASAPLADIESD